MENTLVKIELKDGRVMTAELLPDYAPLSVANFLKLVDAKFYDGTVFHRVIPGFMIQGGGFTHGATLEAKNSSENVKGEFRSNGVKNDLKHVSGVLSMARTMVKDSATSQFFICVAETPFLDGEYAAFGKLVDEQSIQIAVDISAVKTKSVGYYDDVPVSPVVIASIRRA